MVATVVDDTTTMGDAIAIVDDACYLLFARGVYSGKVGLVFYKSGTVATYIQILLFNF